jgi:sporulation protein YlmC with PRC-barrel domain
MLLTELLGLEVIDHQGRSAGRLHDLVVAVDREWPPVVGAVLRGDHVVQPVATGFDPAAPAIGEGSEVDGLWLVRDVLDTQVYDIAGHRISRVGDVVLEMSDGALVVSAIEAGLAPVLRRLGLPRASRRARGRTLAWSELHPLSRRGHSLVLATDPERAQGHLAAAHAHRPRLFPHRGRRSSR